MQPVRIDHPIAPVYDSASRVLILGSFPSVKSREQMFFYGHPQNRFWKVLAALVSENCGKAACDADFVRNVSAPATVEEKRAFLLKNRIAVWDVIASCEITGSSDASIRGAVPNDLTPILEAAGIRAVFTNGGKAYQLYVRYLESATGRKAIRLPSTSPANAAFSLERLVQEWQIVGEYLK